MKKNRILVVDDEASVRFSLQHALASDQIDVACAETGRQAFDSIREHIPDIVLLDVRLPDISGLDALNTIRGIDQRIPIVIITAHGTTNTAIEATKRGAFDYLLKPFDLPTLRSVIEKAIEASQIARRPVTTESEPDSDIDPSNDWLVGKSTVMQDVFKAIGRVASSDVNVLLLGESGVGKELVGRAIYQHSRRSNRPFLAINCAAIPEALLESELFGHEKGAFTGADRQRIGRFEQASGGTVFLDEIGDMSPAIQAKVLRLLQDQRFERVGGHETIQTDVRIIAATNQNLAELVAAGRFRQDLFYRLNTYTILLPPLRARRDDLPLLVEHFIRLHATEIGKSILRVADETQHLIAEYPWPGNVRELQGVIKSSIVNSTSDVLTPDCLPVSIRDYGKTTEAVQSTGQTIDIAEFVRQAMRTKQEDLYRRIQFVVDKIALGEVLKAVNGNQVEASRILGISRTTLRAKLQLLSNNVDQTSAGTETEQSVQ